MNRVKPETRCKHLAKAMRRFATHNESYCPSVRRISLRREDWELLRDTPDAARAEGFTIDAQGTVRYRGFEIAPTDIDHSVRDM